ncbi:uncharacterized protein B0J16DRAFT_101033 [Fusarium flagelliforme]|uniref:uncharacterized protein n=1 Tax=Fusarium flagelliforme TaxID=2675880 RepID=UPI001E8EAEBD|nr:uncharacterized protein B0J16DRAFT_101033 [Fusarium flagelliforme]KAH7188768.1 hypothetical protein B0J16DRAFT_101033 [Fusarium flagelliforme]
MWIGQYRCLLCFPVVRSRIIASLLSLLVCINMSRIPCALLATIDLSLNNMRVNHAVTYFCRLSRTITSPRKSLLKRNNCLFIVCSEMEVRRCLTHPHLEYVSCTLQLQQTNGETCPL